MEVWRLYDLNCFLRQVITLNVPEPVWVEAELAQVKNSRGHWYFDLIEKDPEAPDLILAQAGAAFWKSAFDRQKKLHGASVSNLLQNGTQVRLLAQPEFHPRYGLKYVVHEIDLQYTLGLQEKKRLETIARLTAEGLMTTQKQLGLPAVIQQLAIISAPTAAGWEDFRSQLQQHFSGYRFQGTLYPAAMQGDKTVAEINARIQQIAALPQPPQAIIIIRGGGGRSDLLAYDEYELCRQIALCPIPVLVGIGHETDQHVLDLVAARSLKTPTAVAEFLIAHNAAFESALLQLGNTILHEARDFQQRQWLLLERQETALTLNSNALLRYQHQKLDFAQQQLPMLWKQILRRHWDQVQQMETLVQALNPATILERGYALVYKNKENIHSSNMLQSGDAVSIQFRDGEKQANIQ